MYQAVFVIVNKGQAENIVNSMDATIINGRGCNVHEQKALFSIDPEKEIVLIICEKKSTEEVIEKVKKSTNIDEPRRGIMFIIDVNDAYGLRLNL